MCNNSFIIIHRISREKKNHDEEGKENEEGKKTGKSVAGWI